MANTSTQILFPAVAVWLVLAPAAAAGEKEPAAAFFIDDRSNPEALIRSLYSAVNLKEYARAWSYFSSPPAEDFETFVKGYKKTEHVDVLTGRAIVDGAAGSLFYQVPVAIRAAGDDDKEDVFAGCYTVRQVNPKIQDPPFKPMTIEKGKLKQVADSSLLQGALPEDCAGNKAEKETAAELKARVARLFFDSRKADCNLTEDTRPYLAGDLPQVYEISFRDDAAGAGEPLRKAKLFRFACGRYAYNETAIYYLADEYGLVSSVSFPEPVLDIAYTDDSNTTVKAMTIAGYEADDFAMNSEYDPETRTITTHSKWRGIGDAFSAGAWTFRDGRFVLTAYSVDAAYDGEMDPVEVFAAPKPGAGNGPNIGFIPDAATRRGVRDQQKLADSDE